MRGQGSARAGSGAAGSAGTSPAGAQGDVHAVEETAAALGLHGSARKGLDRMHRSPFLGMLARTRMEENEMAVSRRARARTTWGRVAHAVGPADGDRSPETGGAGGRQGRGYDLSGKDTGAPQGGGGRPAVPGDGEGGSDDDGGGSLVHPYELIQTYLLWRLGADPGEFDSRWRAEAYSRDDGATDAITGYRSQALERGALPAGMAAVAGLMGRQKQRAARPRLLSAVTEAAKALVGAGSAAEAPAPGAVDAYARSSALKLLRALSHDELLREADAAEAASLAGRTAGAGAPAMRKAGFKVRRFGQSARQARTDTSGVQGAGGVSWREMRRRKDEARARGQPTAEEKAQLVSAAVLRGDSPGEGRAALSPPAPEDDERRAVRDGVWAADSGGPSALGDAAAGAYFGPEGRRQLFGAYGRARAEGPAHGRLPPEVEAQIRVQRRGGVAPSAAESIPSESDEDEEQGIGASGEAAAPASPRPPDTAGSTGPPPSPDGALRQTGKAAGLDGVDGAVTRATCPGMGSTGAGRQMAVDLAEQRGARGGVGPGMGDGGFSASVPMFPLPADLAASRAEVPDAAAPHGADGTMAARTGRGGAEAADLRTTRPRRLADLDAARGAGAATGPAVAPGLGSWPESGFAVAAALAGASATEADLRGVASGPLPGAPSARGSVAASLALARAMREAVGGAAPSRPGRLDVPSMGSPHRGSTGARAGMFTLPPGAASDQFERPGRGGGPAPSAATAANLDSEAAPVFDQATGAALAASRHLDDFAATQSPYMAFVRACAEAGIAPEALIVRRREEPVLDLTHYGIGDTRAEVVSVGIPGLPWVKDLRLADNRLSGRGVECLSVALASRSDVARLDLASNRPGVRGVAALAALVFAAPPPRPADWLEPARRAGAAVNAASGSTAGPRAAKGAQAAGWLGRARLRRLDLSACGLSSRDARPLLEGLGSAKHLLRLSLQHNRIDVSGAKLIAEALSGGCCVRHLFLGWNDLSAAGARAIAEAAAAGVTPLRTLDLAWCSVDDDAAGQLATLVSSSTSLRSLVLSNNSIGPSGATLLADGLTNNGSLALLDLSYCAVGAQGARMLLQQLQLPLDEVTVGKQAREAREALVRQQKAGAAAANRAAASAMSMVKRSALFRVSRRLSAVGQGHGTAAEGGGRGDGGASPAAWPQRDDMEDPAFLERMEREEDEAVLEELGASDPPGPGEDGGGASAGPDGPGTPQATAQAELGVQYRRIRLVGCDFRRMSDTLSLDPSNPSGDIELDLAQPYHRTMAERLLRVAVENEDCEFHRAEYVPPPGGLRELHYQPDWERLVERRLHDLAHAEAGGGTAQEREQAASLRAELDRARGGGAAGPEVTGDAGAGTEGGQGPPRGGLGGRRPSAVGASDEVALVMAAVRAEAAALSAPPAAGVAVPAAPALSVHERTEELLALLPPEALPGEAESASLADQASAARVQTAPAAALREPAGSSKDGKRPAERRGSMPSGQVPPTGAGRAFGSPAPDPFGGQGSAPHPLGAVKALREVRLSMRRVRERTKRTAQLWSALRQHVGEVAQVMLVSRRELHEDDEAAAAAAIGGTVRSRGPRFGRFVARRGITVRAAEGGDVLRAYLVEGLSRRPVTLAGKPPAVPVPRASGRPDGVAEVPVRDGGAADDEAGGQAGSQPSAAGMGTLEALRARRVGRGQRGSGADWRGQHSVFADEEAAAGGSRFELPFAGRLSIRVRAGWVDPAKIRRRADDARRRQAKERLEQKRAELTRLHKLLWEQKQTGDVASLGAAAGGQAAQAASTAAALGKAEAAVEAGTGGFVDTLMHVLSSSAALGAGPRSGGGGAAASSPDERLAILRMSIPDLYLSCAEAVRLLSTSPVREADVDDRVGVVARLVERLVDPPNAPTLLRAVLPADERMRVMARMGLARFRLSIGFSTGRYALDLSSQEDRRVLHRLAALSREHKQWLDTRFPGLDTSQWGDFERFRNSCFDGRAFRLSEAWCRAPPPSGILEFDFVDAVRPPVQARPIHSLRLAQILRDAGLDELVADIGSAELAVAEQLRAEAARTLARRHRALTEDARPGAAPGGAGCRGADGASRDGHSSDAETARPRGIDALPDAKRYASMGEAAPGASATSNVFGAALTAQGSGAAVRMDGALAARGRLPSGADVADGDDDDGGIDAATASKARLLLLRGARAVADADASMRIGTVARASTAAEVSQQEAAQRVAAVVQSAGRQQLSHTDEASTPLYLDLDGRGIAALAMPMDLQDDASRRHRPGASGSRDGSRTGSRMPGSAAATWSPTMTGVFPRPPPGMVAGAASPRAASAHGTPGSARRRGKRHEKRPDGHGTAVASGMPPTALAVAARVAREREERARQGNRRAAGAAVRPENEALGPQGSAFFRHEWHLAEVTHSLDWPWLDEDRRDPVDRALASAATGLGSSRASGGAAGGRPSAGDSGPTPGGAGAGAGWRLDEAVEAQELERGRMLAVRRRAGQAAEAAPSLHPLAAAPSNIAHAPEPASSRKSERRRSVFDVDAEELDLGREGFAGPPAFASALAAFPNDLPLPPFDGRVVRASRTLDVTGIGAGTSTGDSSERPGSLTDGVQAMSAAAADDGGGATTPPQGGVMLGGAQSAPEMRFRDFPELFQPVRVTAAAINTPLLQLRAGAFLLELLCGLSQSIITSRQLADVVRALPVSAPGLRIEVAVALFPRVIDLPDFDRVLFALSGPERRRVVFRLGWLNLFHPGRPDGDYVLDLRVWEERVLATILAQLAVSEPGECFRGIGGRGGPDFNRIAGWRLPASWVEETPSHGLLRVHFSSYERECRPDLVVRRSLCRHVLTFC